MKTNMSLFVVKELVVEAFESFLDFSASLVKARLHPTFIRANAIETLLSDSTPDSPNFSNCIAILCILWTCSELSTMYSDQHTSNTPSSYSSPSRTHSDMDSSHHTAS